MKILWFYKYLSHYDFDNWLHLKFVEVLKRYPGVEVLTYGPNISDGYPHLTTLHYDKKITIDDIRKHFDFDAMIMNTKSRMFMDYSPHKKIAKDEWLPQGFNLINKPRIMIEEDYHYEISDEWYKQNRIDLILQRHYSQSLRQQNVPMKWFPFSVDTGTFYTTPANKTFKICFAGSINKDAYKYRYDACEQLKRQGLIDMFTHKQQKHGQDYVECLRSYISHLSCSSTYRLTPAKMFEIMASGSALLTNENDDLKLLFPEGSYYTYKPDASDVVQVAREIIYNPSKRAAVAEAGRKAVIDRHSHDVRIKELLEIINSISRGA